MLKHSDSIWILYSYDPATEKMSGNEVLPGFKGEHAAKYAGKYKGRIAGTRYDFGELPLGPSAVGRLCRRYGIKLGRRNDDHFLGETRLSPSLLRRAIAKRAGRPVGPRLTADH